MRKYLPAISMFLLFVFINFIFGCSYNNYKVTTAETSAPLIKQMREINRYFVVHQGTNAWHLNDVSLNDEKTEINGTLEELAENHLYYLNTKPLGTNPYKPRKGNPTLEAHFYISEYAMGQNDQVTIALPAIKKIEIYDVDRGANIAAQVYTFITGVAVIAVIVFLQAVLQAASQKSLCPLVYINDGPSYHFTGEMYGGAIFSSLERNDYMPLPGFIPTNGEYKIKIANELLERQYTNLAELVMVEHPEDSKVIMDKYGNIQTIVKPKSPAKALSDKKNDFTSAILSKDTSAYLFSDANMDNHDVSNLTLSFIKPLNAKTGKLILNVKNSYWFDYIYGKFYEQFGTYYNKYAESQKKVPEEKGIQWSLDQGLPLSVYLDTENGWKFVDYFNIIGPLASRDVIMPVDVSDVKGTNVRLKLECGFMFWEMDYAAMDFTENIPVKVTHLVPSSALDERGYDVSSSIASIDDKYLVQPEIGNAVTLKYTAHPAEKNKLRSFFLSSRGYYENIRDYKGKPDMSYLNSFREKGAFTKFAKQLYDDLSGIKDLLELVFSNDNGN